MRLRRLRVDRGRLSFSGRGRDTRGTILRVVLVDLVRDREWGRERLQALAAKIISGTRDKCVVELELGEGRNREVRRLFESQALTVKRLQRTQIGKIRLGELKPGKWRTLNAVEIKTLISDL